MLTAKEDEKVNNDDDDDKLFESQSDFRRRKRSHYIIYINTLILCVGFSLLITSTWPYLKQVCYTFFYYNH